MDYWCIGIRDIIFWAGCWQLGAWFGRILGYLLCRRGKPDPNSYSICIIRDQDGIERVLVIEEVSEGNSQ